MATVLIVDDDQSIVDLLTELVADAGHTVVSAPNGVEAFALVERSHPKVIISDVTMPQMGGHSLLTAVRANPLLTETMVILISGAFNPEDVPTVPGAICMGKPLDFAVLKQLIDALT